MAKSPEFVDFISNREREMRVTYFYYNNIIAGIDPTPQDIDAYYTEHRERYRSPASYKVAVFTSEKPELISLIADEWRAGASFPDLRDKYEEKDPALKSMGESTWIYMGQDPVADNVVSTLEPGGVSAPESQNGVASVYKRIARREPRIVNYSEAKERIDGDAKTWYQEQALKRFLDEATAKFGVTINEKALNSLDLSTAPAE